MIVKAKTELEVKAKITTLSESKSGEKTGLKNYQLVLTIPLEDLSHKRR